MKNLRLKLFPLVLATALAFVGTPTGSAYAKEAMEAPVLLQSEVFLNLGDSLALGEIYPDAEDASFSSTKSSVILIQDGMLKAKKAGSCEILVKTGDEASVCKVTVSRTNAKVGVYEGGSSDAAVEGLVVLSRERGAISFVRTYRCGSLSVYTGIITVPLHGNTTENFAWKDTLGNTGYGKVSFSGQKVTVKMTTTEQVDGTFHWNERSYAMTLTQKRLTQEERVFYDALTERIS